MLAGTLKRSKRWGAANATMHTLLFSRAPTMPQIDATASAHITAVILAGGRSSRMGHDKALLAWQGRPFIAHIVEHLQTQVDRIVINTNSPEDFAQFGLPLLVDITAQRCGPLAGIMAALSDSATALTLVVPCDNPLLSPHLVARLFAALEREDVDLAYACSDNDNHYLYALMRTDLRDKLAAFLDAKDYAVRRWYATLRVSRVDFSDQPGYFRNINSVEALAQLPPF